MDGNLCHLGGGESLTPKGKCHFKFPFFFKPSLSHSFCSDLFELTLAVKIPSQNLLTLLLLSILILRRALRTD